MIIHYVGWGDVTRTVEADFKLGMGVKCQTRHGFKRMVHDAAFGYVSGFRKRDILYYIITRSMSKRLWHWKYERKYGVPPYYV